MSESIGGRFKSYEACFDFALPRRLPLVVRVDGRAFHGLPLAKPFDDAFFAGMCDVALALCKEIQGSVLAYLQSDEVSVIARDDLDIGTQPWVGKRLSKVVSLSAAIATSGFNRTSLWGPRQFDSRAFVLPDLGEVINYLIWRQQDATRNSISMCAQAMFSHHSLHGVNTNGMLDRLREAGSPWEEISPQYKRGAICRYTIGGWEIDKSPPIFTEDRDYLSALYQPPEC